MIYIRERLTGKMHTWSPITSPYLTSVTPTSAPDTRQWTCQWHYRSATASVFPVGRFTYLRAQPWIKIMYSHTALSCTCENLSASCMSYQCGEQAWDAQSSQPLHHASIHAINKPQLIVRSSQVISSIILYSDRHTVVRQICHLRLLSCDIPATLL